MAIFLYSALLNYVMASESVIWFDDMEMSPNGWTGTGTFTIADQQKSRQSMTSNSVELVNGEKSTLIKSITIGTEYDHYDLVLSTWISNTLDTSNDKCVVSYRYNSQSWVDAYFQRGSDTSGAINWMMFYMVIVLVMAFIVLIIFFYHRVKMRRVKSPIDDCDEIEPGVYHGEVQENSHEELEITEEGNKPRGTNNKVTTKGTTKGASNGNENEHVQRQEGKTQRDIAEC
eukprot:467208_1